MATPTNTQNTYDVKGNREDLADIIYDISPTQTPFLSSIAHVSAKATNHEWQTDSLAPAANNAVVEGEDANTTAAVQTVRLGNYTQISDKVPRVTRTQRDVDSAGRGDELDYQIMKMGKELKRDMETALLANKAKVAGNTGATARELGGIGSWLATNTDHGVGGVACSGDGSDITTDGTQRALTESLLKGVIAGIFNEGGEPDCIMVGSFNKGVISTFAGRAGTQVVTQADAKTLNAAVDIYVSDFGEMYVKPNRFMRARDGLVLQSDMFALASLTEFKENPLAKTGDSDRVQILSEYTLEARNEKSSGAIFDLTVA